MSENPALTAARSYLELRKYREALGALSPYLFSNPDDYWGLCLQAQALLGLEQWNEARRPAERAAVLRPQEEWPLRLIGRAYEGIGDYTSARHFAQAAVRLEPEEWRTHYFAVSVDLRAGTVSQESWNSAREAVRLAPDEIDPHLIMGRLALDLKDNATAAAAFRTALRIDPQNDTAKHNLALVSFREGKAGEAATGWMEVLALDPTSHSALANLGVTGRQWLLRMALTVRSVFIFVGLFGYQFFEEMMRTSGRTIDWTPGLIVFSAVVGASILTWLISLRVKLGRRFSLFVRALPAADPWVIVGFFSLVAAWLATLAAIFVSGPAIAACYIAGVAFLVGGSIAAWAGRRRRDRLNSKG